MKIGLVLSNTPQYSETFLISKIEGLQQQGVEVVLFVGKNETSFSLCEVKTQPKLSPFSLVVAFIKLKLLCVFRFNTVRRFIRLETKAGVAAGTLFKKLLLFQPILNTKKLDWLHFGFATQVIGKEHLAESLGAKMAVSLRGFDMDVFPLKYPNCYALMFQKVTKVHAISMYLKEKAMGFGLSKTTAFQIISPAVSQKLFDIKQQKKSKIFTIVTVGRLHWMKNYSAILKALQRLKLDNVSFQYHIVGEGVLQEALQFEVYEYGLQDVVFFEGKKTHEQTIQFIANADVYVQYSHSEGFCNAVLEAQALGTLCVVSDAGALPENVQHQHTGFVVPKNNPLALASKIKEVISLSEATKETMKITAKKRVQQQFTLQQQQQHFVAFYTN